MKVNIPFVYVPKEIQNLDIRPPFQIKWKDSQNQQFYIRFNSFDTFLQWSKKIEDAEYDESNMIHDVEVEEFEGFSMPKLIKPRVVGRGNVREIIETYIPERFYIPSDGECFLKCFEKAFQTLNENKYFECKEIINPLYKKFCMKYKIKYDLFPMCKVGAFLDFIKSSLDVHIPLYKYDF